jgi:Yip1 domain
MTGRGYQNRVDALVSAGTISQGDAEHLLKAGGADIVGRKRGWMQWLIRPHELIPTGTGLAISLLALVVQIGLVPFKVYFDGALDVHSGEALPLLLACAMPLLSWACLCAAFLFMALVFGAKPRSVDILVATGLSRAVLTLVGLVTLVATPLLPTPAELHQLGNAQTLEPALVPLLLMGFLMLPLMIWFFVLLVTGFRNACDLRGTRSIAAIVLGVVIAETISKLLIGALL